MKRFLLLFFIGLGFCNGQNREVTLVILGTVQDGGSPHIGCKKECCSLLFETPDPTRKVTSLAIIDHHNQQTFLFEATPDLPTQLKHLKRLSGFPKELPTGLFLTHAHIGHYSGLMYLGREAMGASKASVYAMPKMKSFLEENGPWNQLVALQNIVITPLDNNTEISLTPHISVIPFTVPHRDEFSETVGYKIIGPNKSVLFIPDIDKWSKWKRSIIEELKNVDYAFLDATFYDSTEVNNRDMTEIPHPFVIESMALFEKLEVKEKSKIYFIHLNHTNPLLNSNSAQYERVMGKGFNVAKFAERFRL